MRPITDKGMQAKPIDKDQWFSKPFERGAGVLLGRITPNGDRRFYYRYTDAHGKRTTMPIGNFHPKGGDYGLDLPAAAAKARELVTLHQSGIKNVQEHLKEQAEAAVRERERLQLEAKEAVARAELERQRRITVRELFTQWAVSDLTPRLKADGRRQGRKDGGEYIRNQFENHVFPAIGAIPVEDVKKRDVMRLLDQIKITGKLRTCNVVLAGLKQMFSFATERDYIEANPIGVLSKKLAGGKDEERDRWLRDYEIQALLDQLPKASLAQRNEHAVWVILSTCCRVGELMAARWEHVDLVNAKWFIPVTKNQRPHTIHLSDFALAHFKELEKLKGFDDNGNELLWVFVNAIRTGHVDIKSFGKQIADRQRTPDKQIKGRTTLTNSLILAEGRWTAHDLRRTGATLMARLGFSVDVIDECLNHKMQSKMARVYIHDRREQEQARAFAALGNRLTEITTADSRQSNVLQLRGAA